MIKFFRKIRQTENLAPALKGGFSELERNESLLCVDFSLGIKGEGEGNGKINNQ